jgi:hypothetical protein
MGYIRWVGVEQLSPGLVYLQHIAYQVLVSRVILYTVLWLLACSQLLYTSIAYANLIQVGVAEESLWFAMVIIFDSLDFTSQIIYGHCPYLSQFAEECHAVSGTIWITWIRYVSWITKFAFVVNLFNDFICYVEIQTALNDASPFCGISANVQMYIQIW